MDQRSRLASFNKTCNKIDATNQWNKKFTFL